jgi:hypothetical protein
MGVTTANLLQSEKVEMRRKTLNRGWWICGGVLALAVVGCQNKVDDIDGPVPEKFPPIPNLLVNAPAGLPVKTQDPTVFDQLVARTVTQSRANPFALLTQEVQYDTKATNERIFTTGGGFFPNVFVPKELTITVDQIEPQPFRRLAGVLVGESIMAIIDMGDGSPMQVIRPGMQIPNSPWKVVSIDQDKAILRRSGNIRPKEVVVRLQGPSFGSPQGAAAPAFNPNPGDQQPNNPNGGNGRVPSRGAGSKGGAGGAID